MIYLDNAATTMVKPDTVANAVVDAMRNCANAGRGGHEAAMTAADTLFDCREVAAELFGADSPERIVFTLNATHALNIAIHGYLYKGGHCVVSGFEHNSVIRPLHALQDRGVTYSVVRAPLFQPKKMIDAFSYAIKQDTKCIVCTHVSNAFGYILPIEDLDELCYKKGIPLIIDAAQSAGVLPIKLCNLRATQFICAPGHKSLYGPQGTGLLICRNGEKIPPLMQGGTGSLSSEADQPSFLPDRHESGTQNIHGVAGLMEGIKFVQSKGLDKILEHDRSLIQYAVKKLTKIPGIELYHDPEGEHQTGVLSFNISGKSADDIAYDLGAKGIAVRGGLHCAPLAHQTVRTLRGTVRISVSIFNTTSDIDVLVNALIH